jgi:hypothetical protein
MPSQYRKYKCLGGAGVPNCLVYYNEQELEDKVIANRESRAKSRQMVSLEWRSSSLLRTCLVIIVIINE